MFRISDTQLAGFEAAVRERLIRRAVTRVQAVGANRAPAELHAIATELQAFAEARDLCEEASLHALLELRLSPWWRDPLPPLAAMFLERDGYPEATRVEQFRQALVQPQVTLIDLDTAIPAAPR